MPNDLTSAEIAEFTAREMTPPAAPTGSAQPSIFQSLSGPELADLAVKDPTFDLHSEFLANKDAWSDPKAVDAAISAHNILRTRGFKFSDLPGPIKIAKQGLDVARGIGKQAWNYLNAAGAQVAEAFTPGDNTAEMDQETQRRVAENWAGSEAAVTGLGGMAEKAGRKLFGKDPTKLTPEEKAEDFWNAVGKTETEGDIAKGHGAFLTGKIPEGVPVVGGLSVGGEVVKGLEEAGKPIRPEEVAQTAAGDPISFWSFGKAFQGAGALAKAATPAAGLAAIGKVGGATLGEAAAQAGGKAIQTVGNAVEGAGKATSAVGTTVAPVAKAVLPIAGAGIGFLHGGTVGALAGRSVGTDIANTLGKGGAFGEKILQPIGKKIGNFGEQISGAKPVVSPYAQGFKDVFEAAPAAAGATAVGAATDLGLAAVSAESPQDTQGIGLGTAIGAIHGLGRIAGHTISGQIIAPREYGVAGSEKSSGQFPALDAVHDAAIADVTPGQAQRINAVRAFAKVHAPDADVFLADPKNPAPLEAALTQAGLSPEQAKQWSSQNGFFSDNLVDKDGNKRQVMVVTNPEAAPHESFHAVQDVIGESGNQAIDALIRREYGSRFDTEGNLYAQRLNAGPIPEGKTWQEVIADKSGWGVDDAKEKLIGELTQAHPDATPEDLRNFAASYLAEKPWTEALTPEEIKATGERYMARELAAENFDAAFKRGLKQDNSIPGTLARIAANVISALGGNPISDRTSTTGTPLSFKAVEGTKELAKTSVPPTGGTEAAPTVSVAPTPIAPKTPVAPAAPAENPDAEKLRKAADSATVVDAKKAINTLADAVQGGQSVQVIYHGAEGEPGGSIGSVRPERRAEIEAARNTDNQSRPLVRKAFTPVRLEGKQVVGWSPDNFFANANKLSEWAETVGDAAKAKIPYEIKNGQFTEKGWKDLQADLATFQHNQAAGATGAGERIVLPSDVTARGFTQPAGEGKGAVSLDQDRADVLNYLFHAQIPDTTSRVAPLHLAGQEVSEATQPGRTAVPVRPRGEYTEAQLQKAGISGPRGVREVNPFRSFVERASQSAGEAAPSLIDVSQRLNLDRITDAEIAPEITPVKANVLTLAAGFQPKEFSVRGSLRGQDKELKLQAEDMAAARRAAESQGMRVKNVTPSENAVLSSGQFQPSKDPRAIKEAAIRDHEGKLWTGTWHGEIQDKIDAHYGAGASSGVDGFVTNSGEFLNREEAYQRAIALKQITEKKYAAASWRGESNGKLETDTFKEAQFQPPADKSKEHVVDAAVRMPTGEVFSGPFHGDAMKKALDAGHLELDTAKDGFVTSNGRFVDRNEAFKLANEAGQVTPESLQKRGVPAGFNKLESTTFQEARQFQPIAERMDDPKTWEEIKNFKGDKYGGGPTGWAFDQGLHATPESLADYKTAYEHYQGLTKEAMASKDYMKAQTYSLKGQLAHEAYQFATGERLDGKPGGTQEFIRKHYDPNFTPPLAPKPVEGFSHPEFSTELDKIKSGENFGQTFNADGSVWKPEGEKDVVTLASKNISKDALTPEAVAEAVKPYSELLKNPNVVAGVFSLGPYKVSVDVNATVPQEHRENSTDFAKANNQVSIWDAVKREEVKTGGTGETTLKTPGEIEKVLPDLLAGKQVQFQPKQKEDWELKPVKDGASKALITPDGTPVQLGGQWHADWFTDTPEGQAAAKQYGVMPGQVKEDTIQQAVIKKGFIRIDYRPNSGRLTIEASAAKWPTQRDNVRKFIEANIDSADNLSLSLLDHKGNVVDSNHAKLFELNTDAEKMDAIPLLAESAPAARKELPTPPQAEALRPDKSYNPNDNYFKGQAQPIPDDVQKELDAGKSLTWNTLKDVPPATLHAAGYKSLRLEWNESHHDPEFYPVPLKDASGPYQMTDAGVKAAYESGLEKANTAWELSRKNQFQPSGELPLTGEPTKQEDKTFNAAKINAMSKKELGDHFPEAIIPKKWDEPIASEITKSPLYKKAGNEEKAVKDFADRLVTFAKKYENDPAFKHGATWYSEFTPLLKKEFGPDAQMFAELLAATSPNTNPEINFKYATEALEAIKSGSLDAHKEKFLEGLNMIADDTWKEFYDKELAAGNIPKPPIKPTPAAFLEAWVDKYDLKPRRANGKLYGMHSARVLQVLARKWLDMTAGPKTRNFVGNLVGTTDEATIDVWADRTMRWAGYEGFKDRWRILPGNGKGVADADFAFSQKAFRAAAEQLGMKPSALQGALWFAEKKRWSENGWGRLDLGDFRKELEAYQQSKTAPKQEALDLVTPRKLK